MKNVPISVIITLLSFFVISSCKKEGASATPGIAEIHVVNEFNEPVPNANVILLCNSSTTPPCLDDEVLGVTNENGVLIKEFNEFRVLHLYSFVVTFDTVIFGIPPNHVWEITSDTICGERIVNIKPEKKIVQTITLTYCN